MTTHPKRCFVRMMIRWTAAITTVLGFALIAAGCGGSNGSGNAGSGSTTAKFLAYSRCMRSHGVSDFPDPSTPPGGGVAFSIDAGPGSDLNPSNPTYKSANQACQALLPAGAQPSTPPSPKIAADVRWARCMRSHSVPSFPDPNSQGAFDSAKFDNGSPAFQTASKVCKSLQPAGSMSAVAGQP
ncbi:MAG: hypothetical protein ACLP8S_18915 [Solirubrobacteraceae bacterium]